MTALWNRRAADEFAAAMDGRELPDAAAERVRALVTVAQGLRAAPQPQLRPEFAAGLRTRLLAEAEHELGGPEREVDVLRMGTPELSAQSLRQRRRRRGLSVATGVAILSVTSVGAGFASEKSIPGEALYPLKRSIERVHVATTRDAADRGHVLLDQADTRLGEVQALWEKHHDDPAAAILMQDTLGTFSDEVRDATDAFVTAYEDDSDHGGIAELRAFNKESLTKLDDLNNQLPAQVTNDVILAAGDLAESDNTAIATCDNCSPLVPLEDLPVDVLHAPMIDSDTGESLPAASSPIIDALLPPELIPNVGDPDKPTEGGQPGSTQPPGDSDPTTAVPPATTPASDPVTTDDPAPGTTPDPTTEPPTTDQPTTDPADPTQPDPTTGSSGPVPSGPDPSTASASDPPETTTQSSDSASDTPETSVPVSTPETGSSGSSEVP